MGDAPRVRRLVAAVTEPTDTVLDLPISGRRRSPACRGGEGMSADAFALTRTGVRLDATRSIGGGELSVPVRRTYVLLRRTV
jgi:hypothetical protein